MCRVLGREPIYIDFSLEPKIDKDNPPDLAKYTVEPQEKPATAADGATASSGAPVVAAVAAAKPAGQQAQVR